MFSREDWPFLLHHRLHALFLQAVSNSLGRERLVGKVLKRFGHLDSIISLSSANKSNGMMNVGVRKLGRTTTRGFVKVGAMSVAYSGYGRLGYTSERRDVIARMTRIKEMKDVGSLRCRESFHDDDGVVQVVVDDCLALLIVT